MPMRNEFYFDSCGAGKIRACQWLPQTQPKAIVQLVHGIAEHLDRYEDFAEFLNENGIAVVAQDHMGHGKSVGRDDIRGYFHGGWFSAVEDTYRLMRDTMAKFPGVPYVLFGHSMGSFMARTILAKYPDSGITACIICGTAWQPKALLAVALPMCDLLCRKGGDKQPSPALQKLMFGSYNAKIDHVRTANDWLTRDDRIVDAYNADPMCGFTATAGLYRDMLQGISYIQQPETLDRMNKKLPVLFIAGSMDPVGAYGKGVRQSAQAFKTHGMEDVTITLYPMCRHEILNEINRAAVCQDLLSWIEKKTATN